MEQVKTLTVFHGENKSVILESGITPLIFVFTDENDVPIEYSIITHNQLCDLLMARSNRIERSVEQGNQLEVEKSLQKE